MPTALDPFRFLLIALAVWMNERQLQMIEYLREENPVLREQLGDGRLRLTDHQRRRLAAKARGLGRKVLAELATIVTPETLLRWHRQLIAQRYDGSGNAAPAAPAQRSTSSRLVVRMAHRRFTQLPQPTLQPPLQDSRGSTQAAYTLRLGRDWPVMPRDPPAASQLQPRRPR